MDIRLATKNDNEALLDLASKTPQEGVITLLSDQSPDFFKILEFMGEYKLWVACKDGRVLGTIAQFTRTVNYNGKKATMLYVGELKVHPSARGMLVMALAKYVMKEVADKRFDFAEGFILDGNIRSKKIMDYFTSKFGSKIDVGKAINLQLLPIKKYRKIKGYSIRKAKLTDLSDIVSLLQESYNSYNGSPVFTKKFLEDQFSRTETFTIDNFYVAEKNGKIVAAAAFWDQTAIRKNVVLKFSGSMKIVIKIFKIFGKLLKWPAPPKEGEFLKYEYLRFPAATEDEIEGVKAIIHNKMNIERKRNKLHFIWATFHENDKFLETCADVWKMKAKTNMFHSKLNEDFELPSHEQMKKENYYVDFSIV